MHFNRHERIGFLYLLFAVLLWSTAEVAVRSIIERITPLQLCAARYLIGGAFLLPFLPFELRRKQLHLTGRIVFHSVWMGIVCLVGSSLAYQYSLRYAGAGTVATVFGASPLFVLLLAFFILRERLTLAKLVGVSIGFLGILVLSMSRASATFSELGLALAVCACLCFALFTVLMKRLAGPFAGLPVTSLCFVWSALCLVVVAFIEGDASTLVHWPEIWLPVVYIAVGTTGLAYLLYFLGLDRVEATQAGAVMLLKPPVATLLAVFTLGEPVTWTLAAAMVLVLSGLYLVILKGPRNLAVPEGA